MIQWKFEEDIINFLKTDTIDTFMVSNHNDKVILNNKDILKLADLNNAKNNIEHLIKVKLGYSTIVSSGFRTAYINGIIGGVKGSDHIKFLAMDLQFEDNKGKIITDVELKKVYSFIEEFYGFRFRQMILHKTFIHLGLAYAGRCKGFLRRVK